MEIFFAPMFHQSMSCCRRDLPISSWESFFLCGDDATKSVQSQAILEYQLSNTGIPLPLTKNLYLHNAENRRPGRHAEDLIGKNLAMLH